MKKLITMCVALSTMYCFAQPMKKPVAGGNKKAMVAEVIGITTVTINYDRPGVKGREGKIYGTQVVHNGLIDLGYNNGLLSPWRAGANENTTIEFSTKVKIDGRELPAGRYGFFILFDKDLSTLIFSKNSTSWGSYFYNEKEDALRISVKPQVLDKPVEWLKYEFINQDENSATIALQWEKLMFAFKVEVDVFELLVDDYREELRGENAFTWEAHEQAAGLCLQYNKNLEEGLKWSNTAVSYGKNFSTLSTNASINDKLGRKQKADSLMNEALAVGNMLEVHYYGRKLLSDKNKAAAMEVFKLNAKKNPKQFTTYAGLARGYSANGDFKAALVNAKLALPLAPNEPNKRSVEAMIQKLEKGVDIN